MKHWINLPAMALAAVAALGAAKASAETNWQFHSPDSARFWLVGVMENFAENVGTSTGGELNVTVFPAGSSGFKGDQALDAVAENLLSMAAVYGGHVAGQEKIMELMDLPDFVPGDIEFRQKLWDGLKPLYAEYLESKYDVLLLDVVQINPRRVYAKSPINSVADLSGLKLRALGRADAEFLRQLGAEPTTTAWGEIYTSLQQGLIDGLMSTEAGHASMKFYEVTDYVLDTANAGPSVFIFVNRDAYEDLSDAEKSAVEAAVADFRTAHVTAYQGSDAWGRSTAVEQGMQIAAVSDADAAKMREISAGIVTEWQASLTDKERPIYEAAQSMIDAYHAGN